MKVIVILAAVTLLTLFARVASADVLPPENVACSGADVGHACDVTENDETNNGTCQKSTCTQNDYSHWDRDAGQGPPTITYDCMKCVISPASKTTDSATASTTATDPQASAKDDSAGGCSTTGARAVGPWLLAILPLALTSLLRKKQKKVA